MLTCSHQSRMKTEVEINVRRILEPERLHLYYSLIWPTTGDSLNLWAANVVLCQYWSIAYHPCRWWRGCEGELGGCCCEGPPCLSLPVSCKLAVCPAGLRAAAAVWPPERTPHEPWWSAAGIAPERAGAVLPCRPHSADRPAWKLLASRNRMRGREQVVITPHT